MADPGGPDPRVTALLAAGEQVLVSGPAVSIAFAARDGDDGAGVLALTDQRFLHVYDQPKPGVGDAMSVPLSELRGMEPVDLGRPGSVVRVSITPPEHVRGGLMTSDGKVADGFLYDVVLADELADGLLRWFVTLRRA